VSEYETWQEAAAAARKLEKEADEAAKREKNAARERRKAAEIDAQQKITERLVSVTVVLGFRANLYFFEMTREAAQKLMTFLDGSMGDVVRIRSERGLGVHQFKAKDVVGMSHHAPIRNFPAVDTVPTPEEVAATADEQIAAAVGVDDVSFHDGWTL